MEEIIKAKFDQNIELHKIVREQLSPQIAQAADLIIEAYKRGKNSVFTWL